MFIAPYNKNEDIEEIRDFIQVKISYTEKGQVIAIPFTGNGSGDLANLTNADGFLELPRSKEVFKEGEVFPFVSYRS